jgi:TPR repeat protein
MENEKPDYLPEMPTDEELEEIIGFAKQGEVLAQRTLGYMYETQDDFKNAHYWLGEAGKQNDYESIYALAVLYKTGRGVPKSLEASYQLLTIAAKGGYPKAQQTLSEWEDAAFNN